MKNGVLRSIRYCDIIQERIERTLNYQTPICPDDTKVATKGNKEKHRTKLFAILEKLQEAGYIARERKTEFYLKETNWLGHEISNKEKTE